GPGNDTFAELIGASGPAVNWPRVAGFFVALLAMEYVPEVIVYQNFSPTFRLVWPLLECAAAVAAFRYLRSGIAPVIAAAVAAAAWSAVLPTLYYSELAAPKFSIAAVGHTFIETLVLLAGLSWAARRMGPRPWALWFGAMWMPASVWLTRVFVGEDQVLGSPQEVLRTLLGPIVFAATTEAALRLAPAELTTSTTALPG